MTTRTQIRDWLTAATTTHMLVVCDSYDYSDYPVYTNTPQWSVRVYTDRSMQRVMEVYDLSKNLEKQLSEHRAWNY